MKYYKKVVAFLMLVIAIVLLVSCGNYGTKTISYETNGGTTIETEEYKYPEVTIEPSNPTKEGNIFYGWFIDKNLKTPFTFGSSLKKDVTLYAKWEIPIIKNSRVLPFSNLTTEFSLDDGELELFYEDGGNVPYVKLIDFFSVLVGFIDPEVEFSYTKEGNNFKIAYNYYDETEDKDYELICLIDVNSNTITVNDPGFFWAYIYETETNYGRHIEYDLDNPDASYDEGEDLVFKLNDYNLKSTIVDGEVVLPYYLVNQLFAGSSYYNVYYNYDKLYGIYSLPDSNSDEYKKMKSSSVSGTEVPEDIASHTFDMLVFNLDYFYGLKDIMKVRTYLTNLSVYKNDMLSSNPNEIDNAINDFILKNIDEPHTSYGYPSFYNNPKWNVSSGTSLDDYGPRFQKWYYDAYVYVDQAIEEKWRRKGIGLNQWAAYSTSRPDYWFLDENHAVLILDQFVTADIEERNQIDNDLINKLLKIEDKNATLFPGLEDGNKFFYYQNSDNDNVLIEILVKGLDKTSVENYGLKLVDRDFSHVVESSSGIKANGYYTFEVDDNKFFVLLNYDEEYEVFYLGITNKEFPENYEKKWPLDGDVKDLINSDSAVYMEFSLERMFKEKNEIKSVTLDLTWNSGGNVGALYRVLGFVTKEPFRVSNYNRGTKAGSSSYVYIDGVPSYDFLDWSLLVSAKTFSAANSMATIFKENNLGIIMGTKTGGGAASITPILLPNGTAFTMSSNSLSSLRKGSGSEKNPYIYVDNEFGINPDFEIEVADLFDEKILLDILKNN